MGRDTLADILDAADALCQSRFNREPRHTWDEQRHKKALAPWETNVPSLIQQLRDLAVPGVDGGEGGRGGAESVPVAIDAVSLLAAVEFGAAYRCGQVGLVRRGTVEANIRALVGAAGRLDSDQQAVLRRELQSWRHQAEVIAGWKQPARALQAPCPRCEARGTLLAAADGSAAWCTTPVVEDGVVRRCGYWDAETIGVLARHVSEYRDRVGAASREARSRAVAERRRTAGEAA